MSKTWQQKLRMLADAVTTTHTGGTAMVVFGSSQRALAWVADFGDALANSGFRVKRRGADWVFQLPESGRIEVVVMDRPGSIDKVRGIELGWVNNPDGTIDPDTWAVIQSRVRP